MNLHPGHRPVDPLIRTLLTRSYSPARDYPESGGVGAFLVAMLILAFMGYAAFAPFMAALRSAG